MGKKGGNPHILSYLLKSCVADNYSNHLRMFTCGPVLENEQAGAGFIITDFKTEREGGGGGEGGKRSFNLAKAVSIYCKINSTLNSFIVN